ncbi:molecular chaperone HtpG [Novosphingobium kaempferiae]|uniref:molecular chaperone HtpG n=1 Tax=Novosphingobium kaempferiae TaxID=2896849 RepID=UPI001E2F9043|nr:molecular chaperone HtpG [Novosphingobium kaempferiae]
MTTDTVAAPETHAFEADVSKLLHMMVHSVYSDRDVFLRELISNAADACEKMRYEAISSPALLGDDPQSRITLTLDKDAGTLVVEDNGIGMTAADMAETLGTIARSGTKAFMENLVAEKNGDGHQLIGQFGVGFYSAFMVARKVEVVSRRAGEPGAAIWSSDGLGTYTVAPLDAAAAPARGTRVTLHLLDDAKAYAERYTVERIVRAQSGHVPVPIVLREGASDEEPHQVADGVALWTKAKSDISDDDYADFYRSLAGQFDKPALTLHYRAEGRHEYSVLTFIPESRPFDLFDADRSGRIKLYVRRVFITDEAEILPRYLRFVRGLVDSADLPLNMSREMIQDSPVLSAIQKGVSNRILAELDKLATSEPERYAAIWENFGAVIKEGLYEDFERREALLGLARFKSTTSDGMWRSLNDYLGSLKENQTAIYYATGNDLDRIAQSPQLEGFKARGIEVLLLPDQVDSFWTTMGLDYEGKPFKSVTQGTADLSLIPLTEGSSSKEPSEEANRFIAFAREALADQVSEVRVSDRLTSSAVCIVAPENAMDLQLEKMLASAGRAPERAKPVLEVNAGHALIARLGQADGDLEARRDLAFLLLDEALIAEGEPPADPRAFAERLERLMTKALR